MIGNIIERIKVETGLSFIQIIVNYLIDKCKYHITLEEYYNYHFYKINDKKETFINKKTNDKLIKKYNDKNLVYKVRNKNILYNIFEEFVKRKYFIIKDDNVIEFKKYLQNKSKVVVSKIDGYGRDSVSLSNITFDKLFLTLFDSNIRFVDEYLLENSKFKKFNLNGEFTLNYIVINNRIVLRTLKNNKVYYNIDDGKFKNKNIPDFEKLDSFITMISKRLDGIKYVLIEIFPSSKGIELISINDRVPIIQNSEALYKNKGYYNKIKKYLE